MLIFVWLQLYKLVWSIMEKARKLSYYVLRWQLSTPILYLVMATLPFDTLTKTIIANLIGALIFFPVDEVIFKKKD